jgi:hypothetical protein
MTHVPELSSHVDCAQPAGRGQSSSTTQPTHCPAWGPLTAQTRVSPPQAAGVHTQVSVDRSHRWPAVQRESSVHSGQEPFFLNFNFALQSRHRGKLLPVVPCTQMVFFA